MTEPLKRALLEILLEVHCGDRSPQWALDRLLSRIAEADDVVIEAMVLAWAERYRAGMSAKERGMECMRAALAAGMRAAQEGDPSADESHWLERHKD